MIWISYDFLEEVLLYIIANFSTILGWSWLRWCERKSGFIDASLSHYWLNNQVFNPIDHIAFVIRSWCITWSILHQTLICAATLFCRRSFRWNRYRLRYFFILAHGTISIFGRGLFWWWSVRFVDFCITFLQFLLSDSFILLSIHISVFD